MEVGRGRVSFQNALQFLSACSSQHRLMPSLYEILTCLLSRVMYYAGTGNVQLAGHKDALALWAEWLEYDGKMEKIWKDPRGFLKGQERVYGSQ